jgi:predicted permease
MAGAALAVLLVACANLANLMFARGIRTRRDLAVRKALGAGKIALVGQALAEAILIAMAGCALGLVLSGWAIDILRTSLPPEVRFVGVLAPHLSWRVFAFALGATTGTLLLFGLAPAIRTSDVDVTEPLKDNAGTTTGRVRGRYSGLVIAEVALSMVLLMGAALLAKAAQHLGSYEFGFDPQDLYRVGVTLPADASRDSVTHAFDRLQERVRSLDGVQAAATMGWDVPDGLRVVADAAASGRGRLFLRTVRTVSVDFLSTLGIAVIRGRDFTEGDRRGAGAVIVDEEAAKKLWLGEEPVGRMLKLGDASSTRPWLPVVGVARRASFFGPGDPDLPPEPQIYVLQDRPTSRRLDLVFRTGGAAGPTVVAVRREIRALLPDASVAVAVPWLRGFDAQVAARRFITGLFTLFAILALVLTAIGLYGVLAYATSRRMREFGVRIALGARPRDLLNHVMHDGLVMVLAGTGVGALLAMWTAQVLGTWLYDVNPTDVVALLIAETVLFLVAVSACLAPALQATRADPLDVLRAV